MSPVFFRQELEGVAVFWRIHRRDGLSMGFIGHDRDLRFDGVLHRAAPGMLPAAIRRTAGLEADSAEMQGAITHDAIGERDLLAGRFDGARVEVGLVDWETLERASLYRGEMGAVSCEAGGFEAELRSAKAMLERNHVPRTAPTCRAAFCGPGCTLSAARFTHEAVVTTIDLAANRVRFSGGPPPERMESGQLRWIDGPHAGIAMAVAGTSADGLVPDEAIDRGLAPGTRALLREGCDHTLATCHQRFGNAVNFRAEPFLPGNDLIARYPTSSTAS